MKSQVISKQDGGGEEATIRTGKAGNMRGTHMAYFINLIKRLLMTRLHSHPGVQFHSSQPGQD